VARDILSGACQVGPKSHIGRIPKLLLLAGHGYGYAHFVAWYLHTSIPYLTLPHLAFTALTRRRRPCWSNASLHLGSSRIKKAAAATTQNIQGILHPLGLSLLCIDLDSIWSTLSIPPRPATATATRTHNVNINKYASVIADIHFLSFALPRGAWAVRAASEDLITSASSDRYTVTLRKEFLFCNCSKRMVIPSYDYFY